MSQSIRVALPAPLRVLARIDSNEVAVDVDGPVTPATVLEALESRYPMLRGTIREHGTLKRRAYVRFYACEQDLSHDSLDAPLPDAVAEGSEPFIVIGAMSGG